MCGIAGFIQKSISTDLAKRRLDSMTAKIAHRGPDGAGSWYNHEASSTPWRVALGHRRLSIIDIEGGRQPLGDHDGKRQIVFNGEIYNFKELRRQIEGQYSFATQSDTEVILHHLAKNGTSALNDLNGMFAIALWDSQKSELLLARDRMGIKPLYYTSLPDGGIAFASELMAVAAHPEVARRLSPEGTLSYFFSDYTLPPLTMIDGVKKLEPGHYLVWKEGNLSDPQPFWEVSKNNDTIAPRSDSELAEELWKRLGDSVKRAMISDVPVGVFLSGGLDSSIVATLARRHAHGTLKTFSIGFENAEYDESPYARQVATHLGTEHIEETLSEKILLEVLTSALSKLDEPLADPSYLPTYFLSRLASKHVKVALGGDGGDELWAGYPTYIAHRAGQIYAKLPQEIREGVITPLISKLPVRDGYQTLEWKAKRFTQRWDEKAYWRHLRWMSCLDLKELALASENKKYANYIPQTLQFASNMTPRKDFLNSILELDLQTYLPGSVLTKVDRAAMAHGLEARPPLLENESVRWALSVPSKYKLRGLQRKFLLKKAAGGHLPDSVIHRKKQGFSIPLAQWLRGPLKSALEEVFNASPLWNNTFLSKMAFQRWCDEHMNRQADHSKVLWALFVLDHWMKQNDINHI